MSKKDKESIQKRWARLRFSVVGILLYSPPPPGELKQALEKLAEKHYINPATGMPVRFAVSTIERWFYRCRKVSDPIKTLRAKRRVDADRQKSLSAGIKLLIDKQYRQHKNWSYQLHVDNLRVVVHLSAYLGCVVNG